MNTSRRLAFSIAALTLLLILSIAGATLVGAEDIGLTELGSGSVGSRIISAIRLPRVIVAALVGAVLAAAGSTFQTLLRNPLADPFILGVSGGAASTAAVAAICGFSDNAAVMMFASFCGACAATIFVFVLARSGRTVDVARLLISGLVLNAFFSAVILVVLGYARGGDLTAALRWMTGSLAGVGWREAAGVASAFAVMVVVLSWIASDLRMMAFGEEDAKSRGVAVERVKLIGYFAASLATGAAVAVSGVIGFVGLLVPFLTRAVWGSDYRVTLPLSALVGAILLTAADAAARTMAAPTELPVGALLALFGVPFFVWILRRA